jgi:hypothetical protein
VDALAQEITKMTEMLRDIKESFEKDISNPRVIIAEEMDKKNSKAKGSGLHEVSQNLRYRRTA